MEVVFKDKYVNYNQISDVSLFEIHDLLLDNDIFLDLGDDFVNDWAGYAYYYCKSLDELDEYAICSFVSIITWFMTGIAMDINPKINSDKYYYNEKILVECLKIYNDIFYDYGSEVELCHELVKCVYHFYLEHYEEYIKNTERISFVINYKELELLDSIDGSSRTNKLHNLFEFYKSFKNK